MTRATDACDRLALTRGQLRLAIRAELGPANPNTNSTNTGWMGRLWDRMKSSPATGTLAQGVDDWAARGSLPFAARLLFGALDVTLQPIAQRSPLRLVAGAFLLGGVLAWSRPWRLMFTPAIMATLLPHLVAKMIGGGVPRPTWIGLATSLLNRKRVGDGA